MNASSFLNCDDCYSRDLKSCSKCRNCGYCITNIDTSDGICVYGDFKGPLKMSKSDKLNKKNDTYDNISSFCYKWIYNPFNNEYDHGHNNDNNSVYFPPTVTTLSREHRNNSNIFSILNNTKESV